MVDVFPLGLVSPTRSDDGIGAVVCAGDSLGVGLEVAVASGLELDGSAA